MNKNPYNVRCKTCGRWIGSGLYAQMIHNQKHPIPIDKWTREKLIAAFDSLFKTNKDGGGTKPQTNP